MKYTFFDEKFDVSHARFGRQSQKKEDGKAGNNATTELNRLAWCSKTDVNASHKNY